MIVKNTAVLFTFTLKPTDTPPGPLDMSVTDPDGDHVYDESGTVHGAVYTPPTSTANGTYVFNKTFAKEGVWTIILGEGSCTNFHKIKKAVFHVITANTTFDALILATEY